MPLPKAYDAEWRPSSDDEEDDEYDDLPSSIPASPSHQYPRLQIGMPSAASTRPTVVAPVDWAETSHMSMKSPQFPPQGKAVAPKLATNTKPAFAPPTTASTSSRNNSAHGEIGHHRKNSSVSLSSDAEMAILVKPRSETDADPRRCFSLEMKSPKERPRTSIGSVSRQSSRSLNEHPTAIPIWPVVTGPTSQSAVRRSAPAAFQPAAVPSTNPIPSARTLSLPVKPTVRLSSTLPSVPASPGGQTTPVVSQGSLFSELDALDKEEEEEEEEAQKPWGQRVFEKFRSQALFVAREVWEPTLVWDPKDEGAKRWIMVFVISLLVAFALDPLYLFVASAHKTYLCLYIDWSYVVALSAVKSIATLFYLANMLQQFHLSFKEPLTRTRFYPWSPTRPPSPCAGRWITDIREIRANYIGGWFLLDCFAVLPLRELEACLAPAVVNQASSLVLLLRLLIFLQYVPRAARLWPLLGSSSESGMLFESAWASFVLNLFMYIMASHVVGATWYWLAVQRFSQCLIDTCLLESASLGCNMSYLSCGHSVGTTPDWLQRQTWASASKASLNCEWAFNYTPDFFNYGIFNLAVPLIFSQQELSKYLYALQWGFTAISTLGGSSVPSEYVVEILFMFCITSSGLFLFAVLIGNIQNFLQSLTSRTFEYQMRRRNMGIWMGRRNVPLSLVTRVEELERLKWVSNQGIDESQMLTTLTEELKSEVRRHLYHDLIKKSVLFLSMEEVVLDVIFERLEQRIFTQGTVVIREGLPVSRMFFVLKGELESSTMGGGRMNHRRSVRLKNGDFFGEELLILYLEQSQSQKDREKKKGSRRIVPVEEEGDEIDQKVFPRSENTIVCLGPVEGFVLEAEDLEFVCKQFHKSLNRPAVQHALNQCSYHRRTHAAITLQLWYRRKLRERLGISLAHAYFASMQGSMGNLMKNALLRKKENKSVKSKGIIISRK